jgi:hypothetical protein
MIYAIETEKNMADLEKEENKILPSSYGCEILLEKTSLIKAKDTAFPSDAYLIFYMENGKEYLDLTRGSKIKIFDMYYDTYGPGSIQKIDFGYGRVNPKLWGNKQIEKKKRK